MIHKCIMALKQATWVILVDWATGRAATDRSLILQNCLNPKLRFGKRDGIGELLTNRRAEGSRSYSWQHSPSPNPPEISICMRFETLSHYVKINACVCVCVCVCMYVCV